ncbi:hypothetical protein MTO96_009725 [Rhipicephalus appendiculatus]
MTDPRPSIPQEGGVRRATYRQTQTQTRRPLLGGRIYLSAVPTGPGEAHHWRAQSLAKQQRTGQAPRRTGSLGVLLRPRAAASRGAAHRQGAAVAPIRRLRDARLPLFPRASLPRFAEADGDTPRMAGHRSPETKEIRTTL